MTATTTIPALEGELADLAQQLVRWLETGVRPEGMFAEDVFADLTLPQWRLQAEGGDATFHLREDSHPYLGAVRVEALDATSRGFLLQFEERWAAEGQQWYCRELIHAAVSDGRISELVVYCTGDWDEARQREHQAAVRLVRP
ncbi:MAG TPA: hypothetical protein VIT65_01425 [Microlunatus sp.]